MKQQVKNDFFKMSYADFILKYMKSAITCSEPVSENEYFYFYDRENYFEVLKKYDKNEEGRVSHYKKVNGHFEPLRFGLGDYSRDKLRISLSYIHQIKPEIDFGELAGQAVNYVYNNIDLSVITKKEIWQIICVEWERPQNIKSCVKKGLKLKKCIFTGNGNWKTKIKDFKKRFVIGNYDFNKNIDENLEVLNRHIQEESSGVLNLSKECLTDYLKEENIKFSDLQRLKSIYKNGDLTIDILKTFKDKINRKTFYKYRDLIEKCPKMGGT